MKTSTITATEANRAFSKLLRAVELGERFEITSHGRKIAIVAPVDSESEQRAQRTAAFADLQRHLAGIERVTVGAWSRDDLNQR